MNVTLQEAIQHEASRDSAESTAWIELRVDLPGNVAPNSTRKNEIH